MNVEKALSATLIAVSLLASAADTMLPAPLKAKKLRSSSQETLAPGVTYVSAHFDDLLGDGPVATHWLVVEWDKCTNGISLNIARNPERRERPFLERLAGGV